jgi:hypothetical protein
MLVDVSQGSWLTGCPAASDARLSASSSKGLYADDDQVEYAQSLAVAGTSC